MEAVPATAEEVRRQVRRMVAEVTERDDEEISDTADFIDGLDIDSLMALEIMVAVSKKYRIDIPEEEFTELRNINETVETVLRHIAN